MTFKNFLELTKNLNTNMQFMLKYHDNFLPLSKISVLQDRFLAEGGQRAMTKKQIDQIFAKINNTNMPFYLKIGNEELPLYGVQIHTNTNQAIIM